MTKVRPKASSSPQAQRKATAAGLLALTVVLLYKVGGVVLFVVIIYLVAMIVMSGVTRLRR